MTDQTGPGAEPAHDDAPISVMSGRRAGTRRARRRSSGCLPILLFFVLLVGVVALIFFRGVPFLWDGQSAIDKLEQQFGEPEDYPGPGSGEVTVEIRSGDSISTMGRSLVDAGVVASEEAFVDAAEAEPASRNIAQGIYVLKEEMSARAAVELLVSGQSRADGTFTILPGKPTWEIVKLVAGATDIPKKQFQKALERPESIGLPEEAGGDPEGYLFPGQYAMLPGATATSVLTEMVDRWKEHAAEVDLEARAEELGYSVHELMTVASMVQAEGSTLGAQDKARIARVIYNRLEIEPNPSAGFLQIDATVNYALGRKPIARLTYDQIESVADSPYNTYRQKGLPPGPIEAPGDDAIEAALSPAEGDWFFYATVNLRTGETKFTDDYEEFQELRRQLDEYCETQSERC